MRKRVLVWGTYDPEYASNKHIILGLQQLAGSGKIELKVINKPLLSVKNDNSKLGKLGLVKLWLRMVLSYLYLVPVAIYTALTFWPNLVAVGYLGHLDMIVFGWWFRILRRPLVFFPLISLHNGIVEDRQKLQFLSKVIYLLDYIPFHIANKVVMDTKAHASYVADKFKLKSTKLDNLYISELPLVAQKPQRQSDKFRILFIGKYHPFYNIDKFVEAVELIKREEPELYNQLEIVSYGKGQVRELIQASAKEKQLNVFEFHDWVNYQQSKEELAQFDLGIGVFGDNAKGMMVIPNKIYIYSALSLPTLSLASPAVREIFTDQKDIYLIGSPTSQNIAVRLKEIMLNHSQNDMVGTAAFGIVNDTVGISTYYPRELQRIIDEAQN
jgi:glycosyltransferase involved in cell wall biosynthesis